MSVYNILWFTSKTSYFGTRHCTTAIAVRRRLMGFQFFFAPALASINCANELLWRQQQEVAAIIITSGRERDQLVQIQLAIIRCRAEGKTGSEALPNIFWGSNQKQCTVLPAWLQMYCIAPRWWLTLHLSRCCFVTDFWQCLAVCRWLRVHCALLSTVQYSDHCFVQCTVHCRVHCVVHCISQCVGGRAPGGPPKAPGPSQYLRFDKLSLGHYLPSHRL